MFSVDFVCLSRFLDSLPFRFDSLFRHCLCESPLCGGFRGRDSFRLPVLFVGKLHFSGFPEKERGNNKTCLNVKSEGGAVFNRASEKAAYL